MTEAFTLAPRTFRGGAAEGVIFIVEDDWRTRHFICTVLKYSTNALIIESSGPQEALALARELAYRIDLLISNIDLANPQAGLDVVRQIAANNRSIGVLLMSGRATPPCDMAPGWKFLSIPFPTASFLDCISQLYGQLDQPK